MNLFICLLRIQLRYFLLKTDEDTKVYRHLLAYPEMETDYGKEDGRNMRDGGVMSG